MIYNVIIKANGGSFNIFGITDKQLPKLVSAYKNGDSEITLSGKKYVIAGLVEIKIFNYDGDDLTESVNFYLRNIVQRKKGKMGYFLPANVLAKMGNHVTKDIIGDHEYGEDQNAATSTFESFISSARLKDLKAIVSNDFDLRRLIKLCEELNDNYSRGNFLSVGMIGRTIINHVPPIFKLASFDQVTANYGAPKDNKSFKKNMIHLNDSLKNIADSFLHQMVRSKESIPNQQQIEFRPDMDVLIAEIVRILS